MVSKRSFLEAAAALAVAAGIATPLGVAPAQAADPKVDLTRCLAPSAEVGDRRVFATSEGARLTERVVAVSDWKGSDGWAARVEAQLGSHPPTVRETYVKPGRRLLLGDLSVGALEIEMGEPEHWLPLDAVPGRAYETRARGKASLGGEKLGKAIVEQAWEVVGFEPLDTPTASYPDTVHIAAERNLELRGKGDAPDLRQESDVELWCVDGVGVVAATYAFRFYEDGRMVGELASLDSWLVSATVGGVRAF